MPPNYIKNGTKRCNGPLHKGEYIPLSEFWMHKAGKRKGKPFSQCKKCENFQKFGDTSHGLVQYSRVKFIFDELQNRLGKMETCRRLDVSSNFFSRREIEPIQKIRIATVVKAMKLLIECRKNSFVRHKASIRYGATARGRRERLVQPLSKMNNYYNRHSDHEIEQQIERLKQRKLTTSV